MIRRTTLLPLSAAFLLFSAADAVGDGSNSDSPEPAGQVELSKRYTGGGCFLPNEFPTGFVSGRFVPYLTAGRPPEDPKDSATCEIKRDADKRIVEFDCACASFGPLECVFHYSSPFRGADLCPLGVFPTWDVAIERIRLPGPHHWPAIRITPDSPAFAELTRLYAREDKSTFQREICWMSSGRGQRLARCAASPRAKIAMLPHKVENIQCCSKRLPSVGAEANEDGSFVTVEQFFFGGPATAGNDTSVSDAVDPSVSSSFESEVPVFAVSTDVNAEVENDTSTELFLEEMPIPELEPIETKAGEEDAPGVSTDESRATE